MIAYEELERALARWKSRRANGSDVAAQPDAEAARPDAIEDETLTPLPPDHTGEIELSDAEVTDA